MLASIALPAPPAAAEIRSGSYLGTGAALSITGLGFQPDVVILKGNENTANRAVIRTSTLGALSKGMTSSFAATSGLITSLDSDGFSLSGDSQVNQGGIQYHWIAFRMTPGESAVGTYAGNGGPMQNVAGLGFSPAYVIVIPPTDDPVYQRSSAMVGSDSFDFDNSFGDPDRILSMLADGFQVGGDEDVNRNGTAYHYVAWKAVAGKMAVGSYLGDDSDKRSIEGVGFFPKYVIVKRDGTSASNGAVQKTASMGLEVDRSMLFNLSNFQVDAIQALEPDGFQVGTQPRVNLAGDTFYWMAFGPQQAPYRSIGTAAAYGSGSASVTNGSTSVGGNGTAWKTANRGRGDVFTTPCTDPPACTGGVHYTVVAVTGEGTLTITPAYSGSTDLIASYLLRRQHSTLQGWEDCVDGPPGAACTFFPAASSSLVDDDRREVGIAYDDATPAFVLANSVHIQGSTTDATRDILLTADPGNRHGGVPGAGVVVDANLGGNQFDIRDANVTVEWLEFVRARGNSISPVQVASTDGDLATDVVLQNLLVHDFGDKVAGGSDSDGITLAGNNTLVGKSLTIRNTMIWDGDQDGIEGDGPLDTLLLENVSIDGIKERGIYASQSPITVRNTIVTSSGSGDFVAGSGSFSGSHNTDSDGSGGAFFTNALTAAAAAVFVVPNADLHLRAGANGAVDSGLDLSASFLADVDGQARPGGASWDRGADERDAATSASADLVVAKDDGLTSAVPGDPVSYTITVTNDGPDTLGSLQLFDPTPLLASPAFAPSAGSYDSASGFWTGLSLAATQSVTLSISGTIDPFARGNLVNTATVSTPPTVDDPNGANDVASDTDTLDPSADVAIVKTDGPDPAPVGGLLTYTLTVTNNGPSGATNVDVSDALALDMDLDGPPASAITPSQGSCSYDVPTRTVSCMLGNLAPASVATVTIDVRPGAARSYDNTATVTHGEPDPVSANDSDNETTLVEVSSFGVRFFTATSTDQRNVLEWVNPTDGDYLRTEIMVRTDAFPTDPSDPLATSLYDSNGGGSGGRWKIAHGPLTNGQTYYYGAFVHRGSGPVVSPGRFVTGRPFDHNPGPVKWAFATGATALAAPTVSAASIIATSNDKVVYAIERGTDDDQLGVDSGEWPAAFRPIALGGVVQLRSPVVPVDVGPGPSNPVAYFGAQDGKVYVVDAAQGGSVGFPWGPTTIAVGGMVQAAPAGIFTAFGGTLDYLLLGTRNGSTPNAFVALDPLTGAEIDRHDNGGAGPGEIGIVAGMAAVDYGPPLPPRVYFTSYERQPVGSTITLRCFELRPFTGPDTVFFPLWGQALGNIDSSPVLRGGRVLVGSLLGGGRIHSFAQDNSDEVFFPHGNGQVRGFIFPDRLSASGDMYFATDDYVRGLTEMGGVLADKFSGPISLPGGAKPSPVLFLPGSHYLYVGGSDGRLYELDTLQATPVPKPVTLGDGLSVVGAPSYDREHGLVVVGTEAGIFYAVSVPLP